MGMIKYSSPNAYHYDEPRVSLVKVSSRGLMGSDLTSFIKRAGDQFADRVKNLPKLAGEELIHLIALTDTERGGPNRNGDGFRRHVCAKDHDTFVKHARFYRDHKNTDVFKSYGIPKISEHDDRTGRINLITALNATKEAAEHNKGLVADRELDKLALKRDLAVSMATKVPYDVCSWCENKARTRADYCDEDTCKAGGLKNHIGRILECGHQLHADNPIVKWYDISHVDRGADPTAFMLGHLKEASDEKMIGGAEMAEKMGLCAPWEVMLESADPIAGARIMRGIEKIAQHAKALNRDWYTACHPSGPLMDGAAEHIHRMGADSVLSVLAKHGVLLTPIEFAAFVAPDAVRSHPRLLQTIPKLASGIYDRFLTSGLAIQSAGTADWLTYDGPIPHEIDIWAAKMAMTHGLTASHRRSRLASGNLLDLPAVEKSANEMKDGIAETLNLHYCLYSMAYANKHLGDPGVHNAVAARSLA